MKKIITIFYLISFSTIIAQNNITMSLKDGKVLSGIGKINSKNEIVFKTDKDDSKTIYDYKTVDRLVIFYKSGKKEYEYKIIANGDFGSNPVSLLEPIEKGNINLYAVTIYNAGAPMMAAGGFGNNSMTMGFGSNPKTIYYISRKGDDVVFRLKNSNTYSKKFRIVADEYFSDCPKLINKIKSKEFLKYGIESVVSYYNHYCNK
jgi:hypothetical protein